MPNISVEWNIFESKFSQDPRRAFENLAYTLFCHEMGQPNGIFRYFNQPYIETSPVTAPDGTVTGFQAKYYDAGTSFSSKETELKNTIKGAKKKYAGISRILFYVNKEMSASSCKDTEKPLYQKRIEKCGEDLGITVEWRVRSNIEQMLLDLPNVRDLYFNSQPGLMRYMEMIQKHGESLLANIQSEILYREQRIKIHHSTQRLHEFLESDMDTCVVYGEAGTGKSGMIKDLIGERQAQDGGLNFFMFAATDLDVEEVLFLRKYGEYQVEDAFSLYPANELKLCVIESAEKFFTLNDPQAFGSLIRKFKAHGWKIIFTIRTAYKNSFCGSILNGFSCDEIQVSRIGAELLAGLSEQHGFQLPENEKLRDLLRDLFYLKLYLRLDPASLDTMSSAGLFMDQVWREVVRNDAYRVHNFPVRREQMAKKMIFSLLQRGSGVYKSSADDDHEVLQALEESGVIAIYDGSSDSWMMSHDVYEELIVKRILTEWYQQNVSAEELQKGFGDSLRARKLYRLWLEELLAQEEKGLAGFLIPILQSSIGPPWKDETLIALMQSGSGEAFQVLDLVMSREQYRLFPRTVFLLNTACRDIDWELIRQFLGPDANQYRFTRPVGPAWRTVFKFIYDHRTLIPWNTQTLDIVTGTLKTWTDTYETGESTRLSGKIALYLKSMMWKKEEYPYVLHRDARFVMLNGVILASAVELKAELGTIFGDMIRAGTCDDCDEDFLLLKKSLSNLFYCGKAYQALPLEVLRLSEIYWLDSQKRKYESYISSIDMGIHFGLSHAVWGEYEPASAFQTPLYLLLRVRPKETLDLIIRLLNHATDCYKGSELERDHHEVFEIEIKLSGEETVKQICSDRLWKIYRGTSVAPELLESALMALEKWLLEVVEKTSPETAGRWCRYLLKNSRTAAITAVVLSAVTAYPDKLFEISCILLKTKEIFILDASRLQQENGTNFLKGLLASHKLYDDERIKSNSLAFRKLQFEEVLINYQIKPGDLTKEAWRERRERLCVAFDEATVDIDSWEPVLQFAYYGADLRRRRASEGKTEQGGSFVLLEAELPETLTEIREENEKDRQRFYQHMPLLLWAEARLEHDREKAQTYLQFEADPTSVLEEVKHILEEEGENRFFDSAAAIKACCVLLRDEKERMSGNQTALCANVVTAACLPLAMGKGSCQAGAGFETAIPTLAGLATSDYLSAEWENPLFMLLALVMDGGRAREIAQKSVADILWTTDRAAAWKLLRVYAEIVPRYFKEARRGISPEQFFTDNAPEIERLFQEEIHMPDSIPINELEVSQLVCLQLMMDPAGEAVFDLVLKIGERIWDVIFERHPKGKGIYRDHRSECEYMQWLGDYVLNLSEERQSVLLERLMGNVTYDQKFCDFLRSIIDAEDARPRYDAFWSLWNLLKNYIFLECEKRSGRGDAFHDGLSAGHGLGCVLTVYLLAFTDAKSWHSLRGEASALYREAAGRIGNAVTLYAIGRVLNTLGEDLFFDEGVDWLSDIVGDNAEFQDVSLPANTIYYLEEYMYRYVKKQIYTFKAEPRRRQRVFRVLNFLVGRGSSLGFMLREGII